MKVLRTNIRDPRALSERLLPQLQNAGLFVPQAAGLTITEPVCIWLRMKDPRAEVHLYGTVYWLRHRSGPVSARLRTGAGVGFRSGQEEAVRFLHELASGTTPPLSRRSTRRTPLLSPWHCVVEVKGADVPPHQALLADLSRDGARCKLGALEVHPGDPLELRLPWRSTVLQPMRTVWARPKDGQTHVGLERMTTTRAPTREWRRLVREARREFASHLWTRSRATPQSQTILP